MIESKKTPILPPLFLALIFIFLYLPLCILFMYSFNSSSIPNQLSSFTLTWYKELFNHTLIWKCFANSIIVALSTTAICLILNILLIYYKTIGGRMNKIIPFFYGNLMIPDTLLAISLVSFFAIIGIPLGLTTIIISHSVIGLGLSIPLIYMRYKEINTSLLEASYTLGGSTWITFKRIIIPFMLPTILATGLMIFIISFDDFILSYFCAGPSTQTLSLFLVSSLRFGISPIINALSTFIVLFTSALILLLFFLKKKEMIEKC